MQSLINFDYFHKVDREVKEMMPRKRNLHKKIESKKTYQRRKSTPRAVWILLQQLLLVREAKCSSE
jgi:hypothetical protein